MNACHSPAVTDEERRLPPPFQQSFRTPLKDLRAFVTTIITSGGITGGKVTIDQTVFEPIHFYQCLDSYSIPRQVKYSTVIAMDSTEASDLLHAALSDWLDFVFVAQPNSIVVYADHDEYTTLFSVSQPLLEKIARDLVKRDFAVVEYDRAFLG